jgi:tetrahydromethanopterin S-methyltransferase subunit G
MARSFIRGLLDRVVLVAGTVAGGCVPGFIVQYRQRVGGRLDQVVMDLAPFREIAQRLYGGSMDALIRHHLASPDQTFHAEGAAIQDMVNAELRLRGMMEALQGGAWQQLQYLLVHPDQDLLQSTWSSYVPSFTLDGQGILMAIVIGVVLWLVFLLVWKGISALIEAATRPGPRYPSTRQRIDPTL